MNIKIYTFVNKKNACFLVSVFPVLCVLKLCVSLPAAVYLPAVLGFNITVLNKRKMQQSLCQAFIG